MYSFILDFCRLLSSITFYKRDNLNSLSFRTIFDNYYDFQPNWDNFFKCYFFFTFFISYYIYKTYEYYIFQKNIYYLPYRLPLNYPNLNVENSDFYLKIFALNIITTFTAYRILCKWVNDTNVVIQILHRFIVSE